MAKITWERPSGSKIETNDLKATIAACEKLGWKRKNKRGPKPKAVEDGGNGSNSN